MSLETRMLKPSQPFFVMDSDRFLQKVYARNGISHFYSFNLTEEKDLITVPDGCIDLMFEYSRSGMNAYACGTVLKCTRLHWDGDREIFGVRFFPGFLPAGLNTTLKDLIEKRIVLYDVLEDRTLISQMAAEKNFFRRTKVFLNAYSGVEKMRSIPDGKMQLFLAVKDIVYEAAGYVRISDISEITGYSERYIHKVFTELMGYSPKEFCKIIQFQKAIDVLNYGTKEKMTKVAVDLGYYDQSKFIRDFKSYAGVTPSRYMKMMKECDFYKKIKDV